MSRTYASRKVNDVVGEGKGVLVERVNGQKWKIRCQCGNVFISQPSYTSGRCIKCGKKVVAKKNRSHGESSPTRLYRIWSGMKTRCHNERNHSFKRYGTKGIKLCEEWNVFETFRDWALSNGYSDNLSIDRIDNKGDYEPSNCRWATNKEQCQNKSTNRIIEWNSEKHTLSQWSDILSIPYSTLKGRLKCQSAEEAFTMKYQPSRR